MSAGSYTGLSHLTLRLSHPSENGSALERNIRYNKCLPDDEFLQKLFSLHVDPKQQDRHQIQEQCIPKKKNMKLSIVSQSM